MEGQVKANNIKEIKSIVENSTQQIKVIEQIIESEELDTSKYGHACSLTVTEDKRIVSGGRDGSISISSYDLKMEERHTQDKGTLWLCKYSLYFEWE